MSALPRRSSLAALTVALGIACTRPPVTMEDPIPEEVPYEGETTTGVIPADVPPEPPFQEDAGAFVTDDRCCTMHFSIADQEPPEATGRLRGNSGPISVDGGVVLARDAGFWVATACMPLNEATPYWYEFSWALDGGMPDGGATADGGTMDGGGLDDGGAPPQVAIVQRTNSLERTEHDGQGGMVNFIPAVSMCAP